MDCFAYARNDAVGFHALSMSSGRSTLAASPTGNAPAKISASVGGLGVSRNPPALRPLVKRLKKHGFKETEASITMKLKRGTFSATFFLACIAVMELEGVLLDDI
jgi:hypothetical protein